MQSHSGDSAATPPPNADSGSSRLDAAFAAFEARSQTDPTFLGYRVEPHAGANPWPDGWHPSNAVRRLVEQGGWWPGTWNLAEGLNTSGGFEVMLDFEWFGEPEGDVRWMGLGYIWEHDAYFTPLMREPHDTAPIAVCEGQNLRVGVVCPDEASLLEAFLTAADVGQDQSELLAEWLIDGPTSGDGADQDAHRKVRAHLDAIGSPHPMWVDGMPLYVDPHFDEDLVDLLLDRQ